MGMLARLFDPGDDGEAVDLRLPGRANMPRDVRREVERAKAIEAGRLEVQMTQIHGILCAGELAAFGVASLSAQAELAAAIMPAERARVDAIADTVAATVARKVAELGQ